MFQDNFFSNADILLEYLGLVSRLDFHVVDYESVDNRSLGYGVWDNVFRIENLHAVNATEIHPSGRISCVCACTEKIASDAVIVSESSYSAIGWGISVKSVI